MVPGLRSPPTFPTVCLQRVLRSPFRRTFSHDPLTAVLAVEGGIASAFHAGAAPRLTPVRVPALRTTSNVGTAQACLVPTPALLEAHAVRVSTERAGAQHGYDRRKLTSV